MNKGLFFVVLAAAACGSKNKNTADEPTGATIDPMSAAPPVSGGQQPMQMPSAMQGVPSGVPAAMTSTFGGPNGNGGQ